MKYTLVDVKALTHWKKHSVLCRDEDLDKHWANNPRPEGESVEPKFKNR